MINASKAWLEGRDVRGRLYFSEQGVNAQFGGAKADAVGYAQWLSTQPLFQARLAAGALPRSWGGWRLVQAGAVALLAGGLSRRALQRCLGAAAAVQGRALSCRRRRGAPRASPPTGCPAPGPALPQGLFYTVWPAEGHMYPRLRLKYRPNLISLAGGMQALPITQPEARATPTPVRRARLRARRPWLR